MMLAVVNHMTWPDAVVGVALVIGGVVVWLDYVRRSR